MSRISYWPCFLTVPRFLKWAAVCLKSVQRPLRQTQKDILSARGRIELGVEN